MGERLGQFEQLLLFALLDLGEEGDGASVRRRIEGRTGRLASPGAVYTAMDRLESRGFVSSWIEKAPAEEGGRRRKHYRIEPAGARALERSYDILTRMAEGLGDRLAEVASAESDGAR